MMMMMTDDDDGSQIEDFNDEDIQDIYRSSIF